MTCHLCEATLPTKDLNLCVLAMRLSRRDLCQSVILLLLVLLTTGTKARAFSNQQPLRIRNDVSLRAVRSFLRMGFFDDVGKWFADGKWGGQDEGQDANASEGESEELQSTHVLSVPVQSIKPGGLRLLLTFYLMGMQNTPEKGSWRTSQPAEDYAIEFYFRDMSAALKIHISETAITIRRIGAAPTNTYLIQEGVIVQGILDELEKCVEEGEIESSDRLIQLPAPGDAIERARDTLAFS